MLEICSAKEKVTDFDIEGNEEKLKWKFNSKYSRLFACTIVQSEKEEETTINIQST